MPNALHHSLIAVATITALELAVIARILVRPHRDPASRIAWVVVVAVLPLLGILAYLFLGETSIGRRRTQRMREVAARLPPFPQPGAAGAAGAALAIPERWRHLFQLGRSISGMDPIGGNTARLMRDSNATIDAMVADIDAATDHVHLLFYIWLHDLNGSKMAQALMRAAQRGVACRALVDDLGSRDLVRSPLWPAMAAAGVQTRRALVVGNPLLRMVNGRIDLRNHRKILVIDNRITYPDSKPASAGSAGEPLTA